MEFDIKTGVWYLAEDFQEFQKDRPNVRRCVPQILKRPHKISICALGSKWVLGGYDVWQRDGSKLENERAEVESWTLWDWRGFLPLQRRAKD
jgi:hypothetical protein